MRVRLTSKLHLRLPMTKTYFELTVTLNDTFVEMIADFILNIYEEGLELGEGQIIVRSESDLTFVKEALVSLDESLPTPMNMAYRLEEKENLDWIKSYQDSVQPIEVGAFYIFPSWYAPKENKINIKIDPALVFGSGHHATTFSCLEAISKYVKADISVIDVGCGSGILGLASTKMGAFVALCDTDPLSIDACKENFALNDERYNALWEGSVNNANKGYDIVIANIIADVLRFIASDLKKVCKEDGLLILSGILDKKEALVTEAFAELTLIDRIVKDEWVTLVYKKETI